MYVVRSLKTYSRMLFCREKKMKETKFCFTKWEWGLWCVSILVILLSFLVLGGDGILTLAASLIGVTSLIFCARGNPIGQVLMILFSLLYGVISWSFRYYGEMITYLGMTLPMAVIALVSWLKHPFHGKRTEVAAKRISFREVLFLLVLTGAVTAAFYFILKAFHTANLFFSTLSVSTSFAAAYLTFRRSPFFALVYAMNDVVLIVLWVLAAATERGYLSVAVCFVIFLVNDLYGFFSWLHRLKRQEKLS